MATNKTRAETDQTSNDAPKTPSTALASGLGVHDASGQPVPVGQCRRHPLDPDSLSKRDADHARKRLEAGWRPTLRGYRDDERFVVLVDGGVYLDVLTETVGNVEVQIDLIDAPDRRTLLVHFGARCEQVLKDNGLVADGAAELHALARAAGSADPIETVASEMRRDRDSVRNYLTLHELKRRFGAEAAARVRFRDMPAVRQRGVDNLAAPEDLDKVKQTQAHYELAREIVRAIEKLAFMDGEDAQQIFALVREQAANGKAPDEVLQVIDHGYRSLLEELTAEATGADDMPNQGDEGDEHGGSAEVDPTRRLGTDFHLPNQSHVCDAIYATFRNAAETAGQLASVAAFLNRVQRTAEALGLVDDGAYLSQPRFSNLRKRDPELTDKAHRLKSLELSVLLIVVDTLEPLADHVVAVNLTAGDVRPVLKDLRQLNVDPEAMAGYERLPVGSDRTSRTAPRAVAEAEV